MKNSQTAASDHSIRYKETRMETRRIAGIIVVALLVMMSISACSTKKQPSSPQDAAKETEPPAIGTEIDYLPGDPVVGEIVNDVANPKTSARAYEEMQETPYGLLSRVIVEYKGKKTEMQPSSAILEFSPDGRYLLYVHNSSPKNQDGAYLYNVETGKTQELVPSVPDTDSRFQPPPENVTWDNGKITYEKDGKTWTLPYKEE